MYSHMDNDLLIVHYHLLSVSVNVYFYVVAYGSQTTCRWSFFVNKMLPGDAAGLEVSAHAPTRWGWHHMFEFTHVWPHFPSLPLLISIIRALYVYKVYFGLYCIYKKKINKSLSSFTALSCMTYLCGTQNTILMNVGNTLDVNRNQNCLVTNIFSK